MKDVLIETGVSETMYEEVLKDTTTETKVIIKRQLNEASINNYNHVLLNAWQANMNVQYVADAYACINYVASYVTKDEHEVAAILKAVAKEMHDKNSREQMKKCASAFLNSREVSAQEATLRLLGLPLYNYSIETVFIPASMPHCFTEAKIYIRAT